MAIGDAADGEIDGIGIGIGEAELDLLVEVANQDLCRVVAEVSRTRSVADRQLSVLSNTYPAWNISLWQDERGLEWWVAVLPGGLTAEQTALGVAERLRMPDAIALAAALAWQSALLHNPRCRPPLGG